MFIGMGCKILTTTSGNISLTSLPNEILLIIFTNLDWKSLEILKTTSKILYIIIENTYLPTKKVCEMDMSSYLTPGNSWRMSFRIKTNKHQLQINDIPFNFNKKGADVDVIEKTLEKYCLKKITKLNLHIMEDSIVFDILNKYFQHGTEVGCLNIYIEKSPVFKSFTKFMDRIKYVRCLIIENLCFNNQKNTSHYIFPIERDLKKLTINECKCCNFVNYKMIEELFEKNPDIKTVKMNSNMEDYDKLIINYVKSRPDTKDNGKCHHPTFKLYLPFDEERIVKKEFYRLFPSSTYIFQGYKDNNAYNTSSFGALKTCSNGHHEKTIVVDCSEIFLNQVNEGELNYYENFIIDNIFEIFLVFTICFIILILFLIVLVLRFTITL